MLRQPLNPKPPPPPKKKKTRHKLPHPPPPGSPLTPQSRSRSALIVEVESKRTLRVQGFGFRACADWEVGAVQNNDDEVKQFGVVPTESADAALENLSEEFGMQVVFQYNYRCF